jgi:multiple sugar transport system substrate-binding protein
MFYNEKILTDAGFKPATTWDEFVEQCKTLQEKGIVKYGITWPLLSGDDISYECWASQFLSRGGTFFDEKGEPIFNNEIGVEALQFLVDSIYTLKIASPTSIEVEKMACLHPFMAGENAYNWNWQFMYPITKDPSTSKIVEYSKYCLIPSKPGAKYTGFIGGGGISVNPYSKNKEAAIAYAKFITSKEHSLKLLKEKGWLPWWKSVYEMPEAKEIEPQLPIILKQLEKSFARGWLKISWYAEFAETIRLEISKAWLKEKTAKEALDSAVSAIKEKLKEYGR